MDDGPDPSADGSDSTIAIAVDEQPSATVIRLRGDLDFATAPTVADALSGIDAPRVVVDCQDISFMDSSGLNVLVKAWNDTGAADASRFAVANPSRQVERVIEICGVTGIIDGR